MAVCSEMYLNGAFVDPARAQVPVFDRGLLMAHAAYEVTAVYGGRLIDLGRHLDRLERTLAGIALTLPLARDALEAMHHELVARNALEEGLVYLQVTGGAYGFRDFAGPERFEPCLFAWADRRTLIGEAQQRGIRAISVPDQRWARRDMKTTQLLSQALAYRAAREAGADTALMHEDGVVTEAASANAWLVTADGGLVTRDLSPALLAGITRGVVAELGLPVEERAFTLDEARTAAELFTSSTGNVIAPVTHLDGAPVGPGQPGPVTRRVQALYFERMGADVAAIAPWAMSRA